MIRNRISSPEQIEALVRAHWPDALRRQLGIPVSAAHSLKGCSAFDVGITIGTGRARKELYVDVKGRVLSTTVSLFKASSRVLARQQPDVIPILVVPQLTPKGRALLRANAINYADLSGTLYIRAEGFFVDIQGSEPAPQLLQSGRLNPFTDKASFILRAFLADTETTLGVTELADRVQITKGWVSLMCRELEHRGYLTRSNQRYQLGDPVPIIHDWSRQYQWIDNAMESFVAPFTYEEIQHHLQSIFPRFPGRMAYTLLAGSDLLAPHVQHQQVHLYAASQVYDMVRTLLRKTLILEPTTSGGNVHLLSPYYARSAFFDIRQVRNQPVVSPVQLYLDLMAYPVRGEEAAHQLARIVLAREWHLSNLQIRDLA